MFDGAAAATADAVFDDVADAIIEASGTTNEADSIPESVIDVSAIAPQPTRNEIAFIDMGVDNIHQLTAQIDPGIEVDFLEPNSDGLEQIAALVGDRNDIDAIHILSHGKPGEIHLGNAVLNAASISGEHADDLALLGDALSSDADLLIYGCSFGADRAVLEALSQATGADVAASDDDTGSFEQDGDWELEAVAGTLEAQAIAAPGWAGLLAPENTSAWSFAGNTAANATAGIATTVTFTSDGNSGFGGFTTGTFNNLPAFANDAEGNPSLQFVFSWDLNPEPTTAIPQPQAADDSGTGTITITFSEAVTNPIINLDRLGGFSFMIPIRQWTAMRKIARTERFGPWCHRARASPSCRASVTSKSPARRSSEHPTCCFRTPAHRLRVVPTGLAIRPQARSV